MLENVQNHYWTVNDIRKLLKKAGNLNHKITLWLTSNTTLIIQWEFYQNNKTGRYFTIKKIFLQNLMKNDELIDNENKINGLYLIKTLIKI